MRARANLAELADAAHRADQTDRVRHDRVILAQERAESAFYNRHDIRQALVDRLAGSEELDPQMDDDHADSRLEQIKQQIRRGEYLKDDIVSRLADRLIDSLGDDPEIEDDPSYDGNADT